MKSCRKLVNSLLIDEKHIVRLYQFELVLFTFLLPIYRKVIPYVIAVMLITWLFEGDFASKARRIVNDKHRLNTLLFAGLYLFYGIGLLYIENFDYGLFDLEVKMSIFIFPVLMATVRDEVLSASMARKILWAFVFGVFASMILCYLLAFIEYFRNGSVGAFYYSSLSRLIHPSYMAMYVCFAMAILLYFMYKGLVQGTLNRILAILLLVSFEVFVIMLSSKAGILGFALLLVLFTAYILSNPRRYKKGLLIGSMLAISYIFLFILFPISVERFEETRDSLEQVDIHADEIMTSTGERIMILWYSFEITNEHFLWGVGSGDVKDFLLDKYEEKGMLNALSLALNAHNQYLQMMIAMGIVGLIILLLNLVLPALYSIDHKHYLYLIFLILVGFNFLFESMLETQAGVVFYAFFNAYLFAIKKDPASLETGS